jgi:hypothetical protein
MLAPNSTGFAACDSLIRGQILVLGKIADVAARRACMRWFLAVVRLNWMRW